MKVFLPQDVLMASRNSAYFHLLSSYFLTSTWAFVAVTCGLLNRHMETTQTKPNEEKILMHFPTLGI